MTNIQIDTKFILITKNEKGESSLNSYISNQWQQAKKFIFIRQ